MSNHYNLISSFYDCLAELVFGKNIIKAQQQWLKKLPNKGEVLFIGGGSGAVLKEITFQKPQLNITYVEASSAMIKKSEARLTKQERNQVHFIDQHIEEAKIGTDYDALITFFFIDIFSSSKQKELFELLNRKLKTDGLWLMADFTPPQSTKQKLIEKLMFAFLKLSTSIQSHKILDYQSYFNPAEFNLLETKDFYQQFIFSNLYHKR